MKSPYEQAAELYVSAGWSPIPIERNGKGRTPGGCTGYEGALVDIHSVDQWIQAARAGGFENIAVRTHPDVIGLDVDGYGIKKGAAQLDILARRLGPLPATYTSTARGKAQPSRIYFYRCPPGLKYRSEAGPDIEVIQFHHRHAVVWPSAHPSGGTYRWYRPDGSTADAGEIPTRLKLPELPPAWVEHLSVGERKGSKGTIRVNSCARSVEAALAELSQIYRPGRCHNATQLSIHTTRIRRARTGSRHDTLMRELGHIANEIARATINFDAAVAQVSEAFVEAAGEDRRQEALAAFVYVLSDPERQSRRRWLDSISPDPNASNRV